ncbi:cell growth regulator with RING finger domain protein 1-like [Oratosquilla oratoria]|uniref:cell growth regulator with RING finger domain protein 1-like n=1 Tax=Oratosquilla oratoria TaxID=337810 RepID=UPI003F75A2F0
MVAVLTAALMSAAEISNIFSVVAVIICFICMVIFILRIQGGRDGSVVFVAQAPIARVNMQKISVPFSLRLERPKEATFQGLQVTIRNDVPFLMRSYWGVSVNHIHALLALPWSNFLEQVIHKAALSAQHICEIESFVVNDTEGRIVDISVPENTSLDLGPMPRSTYPLVVCMVQQNDAMNQDIAEVGALVSIIHIKDDVCSIPTTVLHQFLKQYSGQCTRLQALYTQGSEETKENSRSAQGSGVSSEVQTDNCSYTDTVESNLCDDRNPEEEVQQESEDEISLDEACVVCQVNQTTRALLPCRHVCVCHSCFHRLENCPMCRTRIVSYFLVDREATPPPAPEPEHSQGTQARSLGFWQKLNGLLNNIIGIIEE